MAGRTISSAESQATTWIVMAAVAGAIAGVVFAMFEMMMAVVTDGTGAFFMPLRMIGGIAIGKTALDPGTSLLFASGVGIVLHMALSMMFGVIVAGVLRRVPSLASSKSSVLITSSVAGLLLWIVNFQVFARAFGWTWFPDGTNAAVQIVAHTVFFGTILGYLLIRLGAVTTED
jgi:hypothetical protein